jgi:hypothetical protein
MKAVIPSGARDLPQSDWITLSPSDRQGFDCEILHFVQDDRQDRWRDARCDSQME